jgi:hypothetical protein
MKGWLDRLFGLFQPPDADETNDILHAVEEQLNGQEFIESFRSYLEERLGRQLKYKSDLLYDSVVTFVEVDEVAVGYRWFATNNPMCELVPSENKAQLNGGYAGTVIVIPEEYVAVALEHACQLIQRHTNTVLDEFL